MRNEIIKKFLSAVSGGIFVFANLTTENEKPRIKNFGSSLKSKKSEKENKTKNENADDEDVLRVETAIVINDILVLNQKGVVVKGLKKEDFIITEDGAAQAIESLSPGNAAIPRSIVLVIDYSGSLLPYIETSVEAAKVLVDTLKPPDRMAIVTDDVELLTDFTRDKKLLKEKLDSLKSNALVKKIGRSAQFSALYGVLTELFSEEDTRRIVIFQTDGDELGRLKGNRVLPPESNPRRPLPIEASERNFSLKDILTAAEKSRATVYTIYPGFRLIGFSANEQIERTRKEWEYRYNFIAQMTNKTLSSNPAKDQRFVIISASDILKRQLVLAGLAKYTGGWAEFLETPEQAGDIYTRILSGIESRYVIGYYPTNEARDGKRRKVKIEVRGHPEYIIWGRKTYFAPEPEK